MHAAKGIAAAPPKTRRRLRHQARYRAAPTTNLLRRPAVTPAKRTASTARRKITMVTRTPHVTRIRPITVGAPISTRRWDKWPSNQVPKRRDLNQPGGAERHQVISVSVRPNIAPRRARRWPVLTDPIDCWSSLTKRTISPSTKSLRSPTAPNGT